MISFNVPARRNFFAEQTELSHIRQTILVHALAHPRQNLPCCRGPDLYQLHAAGTLSDRISALYRPAFLNQLRPIQFNQNDIQPKVLYPKRDTDRTINYLCKRTTHFCTDCLSVQNNEIYHPLIGRGRFPALFLFLPFRPKPLTSMTSCKRSSF